AAPAAGALLWREGRANFENTPLAQALAEFERYGPTGLTVRDPAVAAMRINGSFDLRQFGAFAKALPQVLPVRLQPREGTTEIAPR
ncbi:iron dicitrate transport regulator FecR, partial [Variovorax sp. CT11-76]